MGVKVYSQHSGTILTPKGNSVEYYNGYLGDTAAYRAYADSLITSNNWDAKMVAPGTHEYNCHGFAWHTSEGGPESDRWINGWKDGDVDYFNHSVTPTNSPTNIINYWANNGGYHSIVNKTAKAKVFYGSQWVWENTIYGYRWVNQKDHSAVVDSNTDYFISKWGALPRYKHKPAHCPYANSSLSYYFIDNPFISGATGALCNNVQRTFSETAFTNIDLDYNWNCTSPLEEVSGEGTSSYTVKGTSQNDRGTLSLTVTTPSGASASATNRYVWVGAPDIDNITVYYSEDITGTYPDEFCPGDVNELLARTNPVSINMELTSIYWDMGSWDVYYYDDEGYVLFEIPLSFSGYQDVYYEVSNACDVVITSERLYEGSCGGYYKMFSPNPATNETTLTIETLSDVTFDEETEWDIEIYDQSQLLKEKKNNLKGKSTKIQTARWKEGIYAVRAKYKDEVLQGKLVVKK